MTLHLCIGLLAAWLSLWNRKALSPNDDFIAIMLSAFIGLTWASGSYIVSYTYRHVTHYQDPAEVEKAQLIMNVIRSEDQRIDMQINSTINGHHVPMQLNGNGYVCRRIR